MTPVEQITSLYVGYFGRAPEPAGLNYWVGRLADGFSLAEIAESFSVQAESTTKYPFLANPNVASPEAFITQVYLNLFNRLPDAAGLAYWTAELANGADVGDFILNVISGAQGDDKTIIDNKIEVGADFALNAANQPGFAYDADAANAAAEVINGVDATDASVAEGKAETAAFLNTPVTQPPVALTVAIDSFVGTTGNDVVTGVVAAAPNGTFSTGDSVTGGAGNDTLSLIVTDGTAVIPASLNSVETIQVQALASSTINLVNATGVETVSAVNTAGNFTTTFTNSAAIVDIAVSNTAAGALAGVNVGYAPAVVAGAADAQNVSLNNANATITTAGIETYNVTATGANSVNLAALGATTVKVDGAGSVTIAALATTVTTLNAADNTGGVTATFNVVGNVAVTGGSGDDSFSFGEGLTATAGAVTGDVVNGGEGTDTVRVDLAAGAGSDISLAPAAAAFNALISVERVAFDGVSGVTVNGSTFTNAGITNLEFNTTNADTINNAGSARTYEFGNANAGAATFNMNGTSTVLNLALLGTDGLAGPNNGVDADVGALTVNLSATAPAGTLATINIVSNGDLADAAAVTANFNDVGAITAVAGSTINISGAGNLDLAGLTNRGVIDASTATGNLVLEGSEFTAPVAPATVYTSGADTFTLGLGQDTVQFSSGLDSGVALTATGASSLTAGLLVDVIKGFTAGVDGDVLDFTGTGTDADYTAIATADQADISALSGAGATLQAAADIASLGTADEWTAFTFQGQSYALYNADATADYTAGTDLLVQITGVTVANLTDANFA